MPCYHPITGYRAQERNEKTGKYSVVFNPKQGYIDMPITVPCGQCIGCRLERSRQWAIRCMHEASLHEKNCFITLTYDDDHLPEDRSLNVKEFQDFMKRFRKKVGVPLRYYHCGEYGDKFGRPHYHACIFGYDFPDRKYLKKLPSGHAIFKSEILSKLWKKGYASVGDVTFDSAAYVARYITKKVTGKDAEDHYWFCDEETGESWPISPEYTTMSRRPGIAADWFKKYISDVYPSDTVIVKEKAVRPPKFYDGMFEAEFPEEFEKVKRRRKNKLLHVMAEKPEEFTPRRIADKEKFQEIKYKSRGF